MSRRRRSLVALLAIVAAVAIALPQLHRIYAPNPAIYRAERGIGTRAEALAEDQLAMWASPEERAERIGPMHAQNPEWDFMARTYLALALADMALRVSDDSEDRGAQARRVRYLAALDAIIDDTVQTEHDAGQRVFLLPYASAKPFDDPAARSLFVDGEIALMMAVRQVVEPRESLREPMRERARAIEASMRKSPTLSGESYPDECWTFCNTTALAALRIIDGLEGESHAALFADWVALAKARLTDPATGMLVSSYSYNGVVKDGPEGSSIWMSAHNLLLLDEPFAKDQYARARQVLGGEALGFGYAREWPKKSGGVVDIDSGPIVPFLDASPASSGLAVLGAASFGDAAYFGALVSSLELAAQPEMRGLRLRFASSNPLGDAVLLSAMVFGPVWERVTAHPVVSVTVRAP